MIMIANAAPASRARYRNRDVFSAVALIGVRVVQGARERQRVRTALTCERRIRDRDRSRILDIVLLSLVCVLAAASGRGASSGQSPVRRRTIVFVAGKRSHGFNRHEHNAGCELLARLLNEHVPQINAVVHRDGWPADPAAFDEADAVAIYSDGGLGHVVMKHLAAVDALAKKGVGIACIHYAVEVPKGNPGKLMLEWTGGYFETHWSVNPTWVAEFRKIPEHPITRGVKPFVMKDEWYYHMRFREGMEGVTPVLSAVPPESTRRRPDGPHSGNAYVRARTGMSEHLAWAYDRPGGGRGFGFTGGHWHWNWAHDQFRKAVLNGLVWVAGADVPPGGVQSRRPTVAELEAGQDYKGTPWKRDVIRRMIERWNEPPRF
jgi:type 1 glutamine amidotransferase